MVSPVPGEDLDFFFFTGVIADFMVGLAVLEGGAVSIEVDADILSARRAGTKRKKASQ